MLDQEPRFSVAAVAVPPRRRARTYFLLPWKGKVLAGTYHAPWTHGLEHDEGRAEHVERFLGELQAAAPALNVDAKDVLRVFWGQLPVVRAATDKLATRELIHDHGANGGPLGLYSISGVKFTMARRVAEKTLRALGGGAAGLSAPSSTEPPAASTPPTLEEFRELLDANPAAARQLVRRLADEESAVCLSDLFFRRTDWGMVPGRFEPLVPRLSELLPWDAAGAAAARPGPLGRGALDVAQS